MLRRVDWWMFTDVLETLTAIALMMETALQKRRSISMRQQGTTPQTTIVFNFTTHKLGIRMNT
jgi:hypothetical protein